MSKAKRKLLSFDEAQEVFASYLTDAGRQELAELLERDFQREAHGILEQKAQWQSRLFDAAELEPEADDDPSALGRTVIQVL